MFKKIIFIILIFSSLFSSEKNIINQIIINGNITLPDNELYSILTLKKPSLFTRSKFSQKIYIRDKQNLIGYYKSKGFQDVNISGDVNKDSDNNISITYTVEEGSQYKFKKIILSGNNYLPNDVILQYFNSQIGKYFDPTFIRKQIIDLKRFYLTVGKLNIYIMQEIFIDGTDITLRLNILEGVTCVIQGINIIGLGTVKEKYIHREVTFNINENYNILEIEETRQRIFDSGLFSFVEIYPLLVEESQGLVEININVREYKASSIEADFGFTELSTWQNPLTTPGFDVGGKWVIGNIMDTPSKIIIMGRFATEIDLQSLISNNNLKQIDTRLTYKSPWTFNFRFPSETRLFYEIDNDEWDNLHRYGISQLIYYQIRKSTRYEFHSTFQMINSQHVYSDEKTEPVRSIGFSYTSNKIQNIIKPEDGYYFKVSTSLFGTFLGGERDFVQFNTEYRKYLPIFDRSILALRYKMGYINNLNETDSIFRKLYTFELGGQTSLRGWSNVDDYDNERKLIYELINIEFRLDIYKKWGGILFFDAGRLYDKISKYSEIDISWDYGFGITYDTAFGIARIEYAIPYIKSSNNQDMLDGSDSNKPSNIHISLQYMF